MGSVCNIIEKMEKEYSPVKIKEPVWAKYITEDNLPTDDLRYLCAIIGLEATKKLMFYAAGEKFSIHAHCNQQYKKQYILDNIDRTKYSRMKTAVECEITENYIFKIMKKYKNKKNKAM